MKLKDTHPLIVWAQFGGMNVYRNTTLCALFWRVALAAPAKFMAYVVVGILLAGVAVAMPLFGLAIWLNLGDFEVGFFAAPIAVGIVAALVILLAASERFWSLLNDKSDKPRIIAEAYRGWKENYCPVVEVEHGGATP